MMNPDSTTSGETQCLTAGTRTGRLFAVLLVLLAVSTPAVADESNPLLSFESHEALKKQLMNKIILLEVRPTGGPYQDPELIPARYGEGIPVIFENRAVILTSWFLTTEAASINVTTADLGNRSAVSIIEELPDAGLAILTLPDSIRAAIGGAPYVPGKLGGPDYTRTLFFVSPAAPGTYVLSNTAVTEKAGPPFERLFMVPGVPGRGTVLFDANGTPVAIAVRESYSGNGFTIVTGLGRPEPDVPPAATDFNESPKQ